MRLGRPKADATKDTRDKAAAPADSIAPTRATGRSRDYLFGEGWGRAHWGSVASQSMGVGDGRQEAREGAGAAGEKEKEAAKLPNASDTMRVPSGVIWDSELPCEAAAC